MNAIIPFDYAGVPVETAQSIRDASTRIKYRMSRTALDIIEIGRDLIEVKRQLGHGHFLKWIDAEFGMSERTSRSFVHAAEAFGSSKSAIIADLPPTILYALAAPSTSEDLRTEVIGRVAKGEQVTVADIRALKKLMEEKLADKDEKIKKIKSQKDASDAYNSRLIDDIRTKSAEAERIADEAENLREEIRRLNEPNTITIQAVASIDAGACQQGNIPAEVAAPDISAWKTLFDSLWTSAPALAREWMCDRFLELRDRD